jgi:hypothetical protein
MAAITSACLTYAINVTVTDAPYGAKGDGLTNDRAAIQNAIDFVNSQGGGMVNLPAGFEFLTGDVEIKSRVTLNISAGAVLLQSSNAAHYAHAPGYGRKKSDGFAWDDWYMYNYPVVYGAEGTTDIKVTGGGTIRGCNATSDDKAVFAKLIGMFRVSRFDVSNITLENSHGYNTEFHSCSFGLISNVTVDGHDPGLNDDGIRMESCQNMRVTGCHITTNDDLLVIKTSYQDPRGRTWWNSNNPQSSKNIEVDHNVLRDGGANAGYHGFLFIGWGGTCPDLRNIELSTIYVHDNDIATPNPIACIGPDPFYTTSIMPPAKDITFKNNTLTPKYGYPAISLDLLPITNFVADFTAKKSESTFKNSGFENIGTCYWSERKNTDTASTGSKNNAVGQNGSWYGFIDHLDKGDARIFQGLYKSSGNYQFSARVQSSGATVRMSARDQNDNIIKCQEFSNTSWSTVTMPFTVSTAGNVRLGIERGNATSGWARIDDVSLTNGGPGGTGCSGVTATARNSLQPPRASLTSGHTSTALYDIRGRAIHETYLERGSMRAAPSHGCYLVRLVSGVRTSVYAAASEIRISGGDSSSGR